MINKAWNFLRSKFNGEIQHLYGADECAKLLSEFGKTQYSEGYHDAHRDRERFEYLKDYETTNPQKG